MIRISTRPICRAKALRARIVGNLALQPSPELSDIHLVHSADDLNRREWAAFLSRPSSKRSCQPNPDVQVGTPREVFRVVCGACNALDIPFALSM